MCMIDVSTHISQLSYSYELYINSINSGGILHSSPAEMDILSNVKMEFADALWQSMSFVNKNKWPL